MSQAYWHHDKDDVLISVAELVKVGWLKIIVNKVFVVKSNYYFQELACVVCGECVSEEGVIS